MATKRIDWSALGHADRIKLLRDAHNAEISQRYVFGEMSVEEFQSYLETQRALWDIDNTTSFKKAGQPPTKDVVLGAWRDLDRSEAILELIDNSIDAWMQRRKQYPRHTAKELDIYVDIDANHQQLIYEDNAGGVPVHKLEHLVIPGFSDTAPLSQTIGSYKTGGKKAIFRLACEARITTRYWNPAGSGDAALAIHLDDHWMSDPKVYEFPYTQLRNPDAIERGQTRYVLQLRSDPGGPQWYESPEEIAKLVRSIRQTYTLLLVKHPEVHVHFNDRANPLAADAGLYQFSNTQEKNIDIRPQQVVFTLDLHLDGATHQVEIEVLLGCRTTTGLQDGRSWGIDLYGNDRLFVAYDQDTFAHWMPGGNARQLVRGYVNIRGPNVFVPWDTHKRHLNADREVMRILTRHKLVQELFENWKKAYNDISGAGTGETTRLIKNPVPVAIDKVAKRITVAHTDTLSISAKPKRGSALPDKVFAPQVKLPKKKKNDSVKLSMSFSSADATLIAAYFGIQGVLRNSELAQAIKEDVLRRAARRRK